MTLSWEWDDKYRLRNTLYPMYMSIPLAILKALKLDFNKCVVSFKLTIIKPYYLNRFVLHI
jgi:hypothetical protein